MPCNLGYKVIAKVNIPIPQPKKLRDIIKPPEIDQDLLEKVGEEDHAFASWLNDLDTLPLLKKALKQAKSQIRNSSLLDASIGKNGRLVVEGTYADKKERDRLSELTELLGDRFQIEVLAIVAQLLDYQTVIRREGKGPSSRLMLEGEKSVGSSVNRYLKITKDSQGNGMIMFEHFDSGENRDAEQQKFAVLAQKLGVPIAMSDIRESGQPIPAGAAHQHFLKEGE